MAGRLPVVPPSVTLSGIRYARYAIAANLTDQQLNVQEVNADATQSVSGVTAPFPGWIVGISVDLSEGATAGQLTAGLTINGTEQPDTTQTITTETSKTATFPAASYNIPFAAGDVLGAEITSDDSWDGTSSDIVVTAWVIFNLAGL